MKRPHTLVQLLVALAGIATTGTAHAQREIGLGISYDPRIPLGRLHDLVPNAAVAGVQGKWEYYAIENQLTLGFGVQYHYFQQGAEITTLAIPNGAATAPFTRYAYFLALLPAVRYFPWGPSLRTLRPYAELGLGITSATGAVLASDLSRRSNEGGFVVQPSAGVVWALASRQSGAREGSAEDPFGFARPRESMFGIAASVAWAFTTADVLFARNVSHLGMQLGLYSKL